MENTNTSIDGFMTRQARTTAFTLAIQETRQGTRAPCQALTSIYNMMNAEISLRDVHIANLTVQLVAAQAVLTEEQAEEIERPTSSVETTSTVQLQRVAIDAGRFAHAMTLELGANYPGLEHITPEHARKLLLDRRTITTGGRSGSCWESNSVDSHPNGYKAVKLSNTKSWLDGEMIGIAKCYMHHLALVSVNKLEQLSWVTKKDGRFQVSHLCHNPGCFNPRHLVVEESGLNKVRNSCKGSDIIVYRGTGPLRYNPCCHGGVGRVNFRCILPQRYIQTPGEYTIREGNMADWTGEGGHHT